MGLTWDKTADSLDITFPNLEAGPTTELASIVSIKSYLQKLASCNDPLGLVASILLRGKSIYQEVCELGTRWDQELPEALTKKWNRWSNNLPEKIVFPQGFRL